jgi:hypothetical protein
MYSCLDDEPTKRPTFTEIIEKLAVISEKLPQDETPERRLSMSSETPSTDALASLLNNESFRFNIGRASLTYDSTELKMLLTNYRIILLESLARVGYDGKIILEILLLTVITFLPMVRKRPLLDLFR